MTLKDVNHERRAAVAIDGIHAASQRWHTEHRRPPSLTAREALAALEFEALVVAIAASNLAAGVTLTDGDRERLHIAYRRIDAICQEVGA